MKHLGGLFGCLLLVSTIWAQDIDEARMARDIEIAEDIISSLLEQNNPNKIWKEGEVNGNYVQDYGVIFSIPNKNGWPIRLRVGNNTDDIIISDRIKLKSKDHESVTGLSEKDYRNLLSAKDEYLESVMVIYLADYADLIGQLNPSHKIMVKSEQNDNKVFVIAGGKYSYSYSYGEQEGFGYHRGKEKQHDNYEDDDDDNGDENDDDDNQDEDECCDKFGGNYTLTAEVKKSDLSDYKSGKIDRDQLVEIISIEKVESTSGKEPELELLSSIFHRLYKSDLSDTYFSTRAPQYDRVANFGVIYDWRVYSSNVDNNKHNMPTIKLYDLTSEERNAKVEELYPKFKEQFMNNMIEYGRTLKRLDPDEILMFKIKLTECKGCTIPQSIELSVKRSVLDDYEKQKIDLEAAAKNIKVREHMSD